MWSYRFVPRDPLAAPGLWRPGWGSGLHNSTGKPCRGGLTKWRLLSRPKLRNLTVRNRHQFYYFKKWFSGNNLCSNLQKILRGQMLNKGKTELSKFSPKSLLRKHHSIRLGLFEHRGICSMVCCLVPEIPFLSCFGT